MGSLSEHNEPSEHDRSQKSFAALADLPGTSQAAAFDQGLVKLAASRAFDRWSLKARPSPFTIEGN